MAAIQNLASVLGEVTWRALHNGLYVAPLLSASAERGHTLAGNGELTSLLKLALPGPGWIPALALPMPDQCSGD